MVIDSVFSDWGLDPKNRFARNMGLHRDEIFEMDLVLAVTTFVAEEVSNLGFKGRIVDLEHDAALIGIDVMDPQLMPRKQCAFELAKYLTVAHLALRNLGYLYSPHYVTALIPKKESSIKSAIEIAISTKGVNSIIVYADLVAPRTDLAGGLLRSASKFRLSGDRFSVEATSNGLPAKILIPAYAVPFPSKTYLNSAWSNFLDQIEAPEITIITPPLTSKSGIVAESYLATLGADVIRVVK
jgi:hypothetical protein